MEYFFIESDRLQLIPLTYDHLLLHEHPEKLAAALGLTSATIQMEEPFKSEYVDALENFWKPNRIKYPHYYKWYTKWLIVLKSINSAIGGIGLAGILNEMAKRKQAMPWISITGIRAMPQKLYQNSQIGYLNMKARSHS